MAKYLLHYDMINARYGLLCYERCNFVMDCKFKAKFGNFVLNWMLYISLSFHHQVFTGSKVTAITFQEPSQNKFNQPEQLAKKLKICKLRVMKWKAIIKLNHFYNCNYLCETLSFCMAFVVSLLRLVCKYATRPGHVGKVSKNFEFTQLL